MYSATIQNYYRKIILLGLLITSLVTVFQFHVSFNWATCVSLLASLSFITIIYRSLNYEDDYYTSTRLFFTVTIYSCVMVGLYWLLSWYMDGDTYIFSKIDAFIYERGSMRIKDLSYVDGLSYLSNHYSFDDWGAFVMMSSILKIIPSKVFLNFCYIIMGGITAIILFRTGCRIMRKQYAYLAAASYTMASYNIFFYGSFLKETGFIFLIVLLFNSLYKYVIDENNLSIIYVVIYSVLICFFRPAVTFFIWFGILVYYLFKRDNNIGKLTMALIIGGGILFMMSSLQDIFNGYTLEGDIGRLLSTKKSVGFSKEVTYIMNYFASLFGPFPTLIGIDAKPQSCLYGSGLLYKFFMNLPFWLAAWKIIRDKIVSLYPMLFFIIIEALSAAIVQKGFELRLTLPHIAMYFLLSFWYFSEADLDEENKFYKYITPFFIITFFIIGGWGMLR